MAGDGRLWYGERVKGAVKVNNEGERQRNGTVKVNVVQVCDGRLWYSKEL